MVYGLSTSGCGYTTRPGLASYLKTIYVKPLTNKIDLTQLTNDYQHFPVYRHGLESDVTTAIINRFQFTGLLRPASPTHGTARSSTSWCSARCGGAASWTTSSRARRTTTHA